MRIAHLLRKYDLAEWGGTETAICQLTSGLRSHGAESLVYAPRIDGADPGAEWAFAEGERPVRRFRAWMPVWRMEPERKRKLLAVGGNLLSFDLFGSLLAEPELDVIHSHALGRIGAIGRTVAGWRRVPFVVTIHGGVYDLSAQVRASLHDSSSKGWDWGRPFGMLLRARQLLSEADAVITCNAREAELISERHPGRRVLIQPHGIPAARYSADQRTAALSAFPAVAGRELFVVVGRIDPVKNQRWLVDQAADLVRRHPQLLVALVGPCTDRAYGDELEAAIAARGLRNHVLLAGRLPPGDPRLIGLLQLARSVVVPSLSETFGLVILEAWAAGTPVLSSRTSGARGLVEDGVTGRLFDLDDPAAFHAAADLFLAEPAEGSLMGAEGRRRVFAEFDTGILAGRMLRLYEELIRNRHALRHSA